MPWAKTATCNQHPQSGITDNTKLHDCCLRLLTLALRTLASVDIVFNVSAQTEAANNRLLNNTAFPSQENLVVQARENCLDAVGGPVNLSNLKPFRIIGYITDTLRCVTL